MKQRGFFAKIFLGANKPKIASPMIEVLRNNLLFETLNDTEFRYLSQFIFERIYHTGEPVFLQNERGIGMYLIAQGRVEIRSPSRDGEVRLTTLGEKSFFGEMALIQNEDVRSASAIAIEPTTLYGLFKPDLMEILERKPAMGVKIMLQMSIVLANRLSETSSKVVALPRSRMAG